MKIGLPTATEPSQSPSRPGRGGWCGTPTRRTPTSACPRRGAVPTANGAEVPSRADFERRSTPARWRIAEPAQGRGGASRLAACRAGILPAPGTDPHRRESRLGWRAPSWPGATRIFGRRGHLRQTALAEPRQLRAGHANLDLAPGSMSSLACLRSAHGWGPRATHGPFRGTRMFVSGLAPRRRCASLLDSCVRRCRAPAEAQSAAVMAVSSHGQPLSARMGRRWGPGR